MIFLQKGKNSSKFFKYADEYNLDGYFSSLSIDTEILKKLVNKRIKRLQKLLKEIDEVENAS